MSATYITSNNLHVFPFGSPRLVDPLARVLNEQNLTTLVRNLTDRSNYVIKPYSAASEDSLDFVIQGYYFSLDNITALLEELENKTGKKVYAKAAIVTDPNSDYRYLSGNDYEHISDTGGSIGNPTKLSEGRTYAPVNNTTKYFSYTNTTDSSQELKVKVIETTETADPEIYGDVTVFNDSIEVSAEATINFNVTTKDTCSILISVGDTSESVNNKFSGLELYFVKDLSEFASTESDISNSLCLLEYVESAWQVPADSLIKVQARSMAVSSIHCGTSTILID